MTQLAFSMRPNCSSSPNPNQSRNPIRIQYFPLHDWWPLGGGDGLGIDWCFIVSDENQADEVVLLGMFPFVGSQQPGIVMFRQAEGTRNKAGDAWRHFPRLSSDSKGSDYL